MPMGRTSKTGGAPSRATLRLSTGPPLRVGVLRLANDDHVVALTVPHIVADGLSLAVIMREIGELYSAATRGTLAALSAPPQFSAYVQAKNWPRQKSHR